jgi:GalNAc-alpha-(1->4)-GalNAc-alpha-(1->3)-diNAcBac-PP-undecaprenol alpha-1,4-N-acetyl-D-galactosaminyltransferase
VNYNNLSDFIFFRTGDTSKILKKSKIFVSLQQHENYPSQSLIEAIATKNIIIATDVGDTRKIVKEKYSKLISIDTYSLVEALLDLFEKEEQMDEVAELALIDLKATHNIEKFYNYLNTIWDQALNKRI